MRVRIVSDGSVHGTRVLDEQGNAIEDVKEVLWYADADSQSVHARLILTRVRVDLVANDEQEH